MFGDFTDVEASKTALRQKSDIHDNDHDESFITASPLDYHLFRQEITSKYPAYSPPAPLVPIEDQNNSILPPLDTHPSRQMSQENLKTTASDMNGNHGSIFNQPVHIATPAPSPPPSPAGPSGKGGKKQNYQTNQNFPFLYPPSDETNNNLWGNAIAKSQDQIVAKKWEGGNVPASIVEAGQLFASRMRMSRSLRQLWDVRESYIKYERGWNDPLKDEWHKTSEMNSVDARDGGDKDTGKGTDSKARQRGSEIESSDDAGLDNKVVQRRLNAIDDFYVGFSEP